MFRYKSGKRPVIRRMKLVVEGHDLHRMPARFHVDEVFAVGEKLPRLHLVKKLAEKFGRRWQNRAGHQAAEQLALKLRRPDRNRHTATPAAAASMIPRESPTAAGRPNTVSVRTATAKGPSASASMFTRSR